MNKSIKFLILSLTVVVLLISINKVMDYDKGFQAKEFIEELGVFADSNQLQITTPKEIDIQNINLTLDKYLKLKYHTLINTITSKGFANGLEVNISTKDSKDKFKCKALCLGDHVYSTEVEFKNYNSSNLKILKHRFEKRYYNIKVVWTANSSL